MPKEHGAYGQLALPLATALGAAGLTMPALLLVTSAAALFVAHEPASILLGFRGPRAARELRQAARRELAWCIGIAAIAGASGVLSMPSGARWALAVPAGPAVLLGIVSIRGHEKSWLGEVAAAVTFAGMAVPVAMAAGAPPGFAAAIALPFVVLFVAGTLAVRTVVLRFRGGGDARATSITRHSLAGVVITSLAGLAWLVSRDVLPPATLVAAAPGLVLALGVVARPPRPARLRTIGWTLVGTSVFAAAVLVGTT